jgi:hypothetical protein
MTTRLSGRGLVAALTVFVALLVLTGCGDDDDGPAGTEAQLERFCDAWVVLASGEARPVDEAERLLTDLERNAPAEIAPTVEAVTPHLREVSATFRRLGANPSDADLARALDGLSPDARAVVAELAAVAEEREPPGPTAPGPATELVSYAGRECD